MLPSAELRQSYQTYITWSHGCAGLWCVQAFFSTCVAEPRRLCKSEPGHLPPCASAAKLGAQFWWQDLYQWWWMAEGIFISLINFAGMTVRKITSWLPGQEVWVKESLGGLGEVTLLLQSPNLELLQLLHAQGWEVGTELSWQAWGNHTCAVRLRRETLMELKSLPL